VKTSERIYRLLLRLYPRDFGDEYGAEMARLYRDRARDEGALRLWLALLADVLRTAPKEQLSMLMQDIRHAFRLFSRTPIVTATGLITVALGVGGSTAVFSVVYAVMMRPLPYPAPDRIVELFEDNPQANRPLFRVSTLNYLSWAERATSMEALAAFGSAGFEPEGVITARISLPRARYPDGARTLGFHRRLLESLNGISQVQAVALGTSAPFAPGVRAGGRARDRAEASLSPDAWVEAVEHMVSPGYFQVLDVPLLAGRSFGQQDGLGSPPVAVVSESVARQLWGDKSPIGQTLEWNGARQHEVVGVVRDIRGADGRGARGGGLDREPSAAVYFSATQLPQRTMTLLVRTSGEPSAIVPAIARAVQDIDPAQPVYQVRRLQDWLEESAAEPRFTTTLSGVFAVVALLLAAAGVYGVLSYSVAQRTQEIGVRMAIGAERGQVMRLVLRGGMAWALTGITIGLLSAFALSRVLGSLLFEVGARDPITYSTVGVMLALVAMLACHIPAARATRIDPVIALRTE